MPTTRAVALCVLAVALATTAFADFPYQMNYQVMLTDDLDQPLANQTVTMVFTLYAAESGGSPLWTETQSVTTNSIGVASVMLGAVTPLIYYDFNETWLEVEVNGETMSPRRPLLSTPYAKAALVASAAWDTEYLGGYPADDYALYEVLSEPSIINNPGNPLEWTRLKNVPAGFADGADDTGPGDGHSLDALDGDPADALYVNEDGVVRVGEPVTAYDGKFTVKALGQTAAEFQTFGESPAMHISASGVVSGQKGLVVTLGDTLPHTWTSHPAAISATTDPYLGGTGDATAAFLDSEGDVATLIALSAHGDGDALRAVVDDYYPAGTGYSGYFEGGDGVYIERDDGYQALEISNPTTGAAADAVWIYTENGATSNTWALYSKCYQGEAGRFSKYVDDTKYALNAIGATVSSEALYVYGTILHEGSLAKSVRTSRGREAVFGVNAPESEVIASGVARLAGGAASVEFDRLFTEAIDGEADIRVTATPTGGWSALYTESIGATGFEVRSGAGDMDVEFHWVAIGHAAGWESSRSLAIPDPEEEARLAMEKEASSLHRATHEARSPLIHRDR